MRTGLFVAAVLLTASLAPLTRAAEFYEAEAFATDYVSPFPKSTVGDYFASGYKPGLPALRHIRMEGRIEQGDAAKLAPLLQGADPFGSIVLSMNSPGGNFEAGIKLGDAIAQASVMTFVGPGDECLSSCAFAFLGGQQMVIRGVLTAPARVLHVGGTLGLHAPSLPGKVPAALLETEAAVLLADVAKPTRENIQDLQRRSGPWQISPNLLFEILGRVGASEFLYIDRWHEAYENEILVVADAIRPPPHVGMIEALQGCSLVLGTLLWEANPTAGAPYYTGVRDDWLPGAAFFRFGLGQAFDVAVVEGDGGPVYTITQVIGGRGTVACEVRRVGETWTATPSGDLPTTSDMARLLKEGGGLVLNSKSALGFGLPWPVIGASDLYVRDAERLWEGLPPDILAAADELDLCEGDQQAIWSVVCRFPLLQRSVAVLDALADAGRADLTGAAQARATWSADIERLCRPQEAGFKSPIAETMAGYCGLSVTHALIREGAHTWLAK
ncbi:MAG: hypothetical protein WD341_14825 [Tistlia sp.]|uniref:hypothetical protein n=1 Tax=Tistlia sp. TaxID=3057121 RepID=UPI0034A56789